MKKFAHHKLVYPIWNNMVGDNIFVVFPFIAAAVASWFVPAYWVFSNAGLKANHACYATLAACSVVGVGLFAVLCVKDSIYEFVVLHILDEDREPARPRMWVLATVSLTPVGMLIWLSARKVPLVRLLLDLLVAYCLTPVFDTKQNRWRT